MVFPQIEDGLMKIMLCWTKNNDDCTTPKFSAEKYKWWWMPLEGRAPRVKSPSRPRRESSGGS